MAFVIELTDLHVLINLNLGKSPDILFLNLNGKYLLIKIIIVIKGVEAWTRFIILPKGFKLFLLLSLVII